MGPLPSLLIAALAWGMSFQASLEQGRRLLDQRDYRGALAVFEEMIVADPRNAEPHFYSGLALAETGSLREALVSLERAVELDPDRPEFVLTYSEVLHRAGKAPSALAVLARFEDETFLARLDGPELWLLGDLFYRFERFDRSREILGRIQPRDGRVEFRLAQIDLKTSRFDEAIQIFRRLTAVPSLAASAHYSIGLAYFFQNRFDQARDAILEALALEPNHADYLYQLGVVLIELDEPARVIEQLRVIEPRASQFPRISYVLGQAHRRLGNREKAKIYFDLFQKGIDRREEAKAQNSQLLELHREALQLLQQGEAGAARDLFGRILEIDPRDATAHSFLAKIYMSSGLWDRAYRHLEALQAIDSQSFDLQYLMASYWYEQGDRGRALSHAEKAKASRPGDADVRNLLGNIYLALGQRHAALEEYEAALSLQPDRSDFRLNYEAAKKLP